MLVPAKRSLVPPNFPVIANLPIHRQICDLDVPDDPLVRLLPTGAPTAHVEYGPTTWGRRAYAKSFEKFFYAEPSDFFKLYPDSVKFADRALLTHYSFLRDSRVMHLTATEKNLDSTTAVPKSEHWQTERDYLEANGWGPYVREFARIDRGARPRVLWYLFLKKEILKREKIKDADIRQIVCSDPIYARIGAALEQDQNNRMKRSTHFSSGQCGWTPFRGGFEARCRRLASKPGTFIELDWTRFDGTIPMPLLLHIKSLRWRLMNLSHRQRYRHIYSWYCKNIAKRYVCLPSGEITIQRRGNPSGQISTTMDNNMVNYWLQAFEYHYMGCDLTLWCDYDTLVYGDDRLSRHPCIPPDYKERVVAMYKDVFGMWVKPEKVKISPRLEGLSFCGFTIGENYVPVPSAPYKLLAGLVTPCKDVPDLDSFHGKLLCYQILAHYLDDEHPFKHYINRCLAVVFPHTSGQLPKYFTGEQLDRLWRGGPKKSPDG